MDKHTKSDGSRRVEEALCEVFHAVTPNPSFVAGLEEQLLSRMEEQMMPQAAQPVEQVSFLDRILSSLIWLKSPFGQRRWAMAALVLLVAAILTVAALGPQHVLAEFRRLVGYVPGIGFVDLEQARILAAPVELTRDGITLRVTQLLAKPDGTEVVIASEGRKERFDSASFHGFEAYLSLPDGTILESHQWKLAYSEGTLHFPALPEQVYQVTLQLPRLPLVEEADSETAAVAPEGWRIPLTLLPASGELVETLFVQPYRPVGASDTHEDVTLRVVDVAHSAQETLLQVEIAWMNREWRFGDTLDVYYSPQLQDDLAHVAFSKPVNGYSVVQKVVVIEEQAAPTPIALPEASHSIAFAPLSMAFAPLSPSASRFRLWIEGVPFSTEVKESFTVDLGDNVQPGHYWPLDEQLTVAGLPIDVVGMWLEEETDGGRTRYQLAFDMVAEKTKNGQLTEISLEIPALDAIWGHGVLINDRTHIQPDINFFDTLPDGPFTVEIVSAGFFIEGPWELDWDVPGAEESQHTVSPITLHPTTAQATQNGITLRVEEATMSDRLSAITVQVEDLPPEMSFNGLLSWNLVNNANDLDDFDDLDDLYLSDSLGGRYTETLSYLDWRPNRQLGPPMLAEPNKSKLIWPKVDPLAQRVTLHVPAIEVIWQDYVEFEIAMPQEMVLQPTDNGTLVSDPWPVEIPLNVAGYAINITEANLSRRDDHVRLELAIEQIPDQQNGRSLRGLQIANITAADGHDMELFGYPYHSPYFISDDRTDRTYMTFEFAMERTLPIPPLIHIQLEGAIIGVPGAWDLSWEVP